MTNFFLALAAIKETLALVNQILKLVEKNKDEPWFKEMIAAAQAQKSAQTAEDRKLAAERNRDLLNSV